MLHIMTILFGLAMSSTISLNTTYIPFAEWEAQVGDRFIADTQANVGYIVHENGDYTSVRVGSGKRRIVQYMGRRYNAETPIGNWAVKSTHIQGDKGIFGKTGKFLRLYYNGDERTAYGIHATGNIEDILAKDDRYISMGCILVHDDVLKVLEKIYELNGGMLEVATTYGINENLLMQTPNI